MPILKRASVAFIMAADTKRFLAQGRNAEWERNNRVSWGLFGGEADDGDTAEDALIREIEEETGLIITDTSQVSFVANPHSERKTLSSLFFICVAHEFRPNLCDESAGYQWSTLNDWPQPAHFMMERSITRLQEYFKRRDCDNHPAIPVHLSLTCHG